MKVDREGRNGEIRRSRDEDEGNDGGSKMERKRKGGLEPISFTWSGNSGSHRGILH